LTLSFGSAESWQKQRGKDRNDPDDHQEFDQCKAADRSPDGHRRGDSVLEYIPPGMTWVAARMHEANATISGWRAEPVWRDGRAIVTRSTALTW
jgi:hypothetical protein